MPAQFARNTCWTFHQLSRINSSTTWHFVSQRSVRHRLDSWGFACPMRHQIFIFSATSSGAHPLQIQYVPGGCFPGGKATGVTSHLYLVPRLRIDGAILPILLYALMACERKTSPFICQMSELEGNPPDMNSFIFRGFPHSLRICWANIPNNASSTSLKSFPIRFSPLILTRRAPTIFHWRGRDA